MNSTKTGKNIAIATICPKFQLLSWSEIPIERASACCITRNLKIPHNCGAPHRKTLNSSKRRTFFTDIMLRTFALKIFECFNRLTTFGRRRAESVQIRVLASTTDTNSEPPTAKTPKAIVSVLDRVDPSVQQSRVIFAASTGDITAGGEPDFEMPIWLGPTFGIIREMKVYKNKIHDIQMTLSRSSFRSESAPLLHTKSIDTIVTKAAAHVTSTVKPAHSLALMPNSFLIKMTTEASWTENVSRAAASA
jgi:hypothetical protein